jgi:hypothetical protein
MSLDSRIQARAATIINRAAKTITYRRITAGTGPRPVSTSTDTVVKGRILGFPTNLIDGTLIQAADVQVLVPATSLSFVPTTLDQIVIDGRLRKIQSVTPQYVAELPAFYKLHAR